MIAWIKSHKLLTAALAGGAFLLYYLWKNRPSSSSADTSTQDYLNSLYGASGGGTGGAANPNAGQGGGTGLVDLATLQGIATPGGAVNQPGTSGSGVPSSSNQTQEFTPNTKATPAPTVAPIASAFTPSPVSTTPNAAPSVPIPCNPNDATCFTTNAYIKASNQDINAHEANMGLEPGFTQAQFDAAWAASNNGVNPAILNASLGTQDVISPYAIPNEEYARAGFVRNAAGTYDAINQGASITGFDASGNPIVNWGNYTGPGSPNYKAPTAPPPAPTTAPPPPAPVSADVTPTTRDNPGPAQVGDTGGRGPGSPPVTIQPVSVRRGGARIPTSITIPTNPLVSAA